MFQRFLVPLDGSERAEKAIPVAAALARASGGTLTLVRVIEPPQDREMYGATVLASETQSVQSTVSAEAKSYLDQLLNAYSSELDGIHTVLEVIPGAVPSTLFSLASQEHQDLIIMCSRGNSWLKRWVLGSVTQATFRGSPFPVLALNEHSENGALFQRERPLRILIPLDGSELSKEVLVPVFQLLSLISPSKPHRIHFLRVVATPTIAGGIGGDAYVPDAFQEKEIQKAEQDLHALVQHLSQTNPEAADFVITTSVVSNPDIAGTILKLARPTAYEGEGPDYDFIALTTHGRTGLKRILLGSITEHVFGATSLPLLVVHPSTAQFHVQVEPQGKEKLKEGEQNWVGLL